MLSHISISDVDGMRDPITNRLVRLAKVRCGRSAHYKYGTYLVRCEGEPAEKRKDNYHYIPYERVNNNVTPATQTQVHAVLNVKQLCTIEKSGSVFRVAVGQMLEATPVGGAGLDTTYNTDSAVGGNPSADRAASHGNYGSLPVCSVLAGLAVSARARSSVH